MNIEKQMQQKLIIGCVAGQIVLPSDIRRLLVLHGVQLGAIGDPVAEAAAVRASPLVAHGEVLLVLSLDRSQERRDLESTGC